MHIKWSSIKKLMDLYGAIQTQEHTVSTGTNGVLTPDLSKALQAEILNLKMREKTPFAVMETSGKTVNVYHLKYEFVPMHGWALATVCVLAKIPNKKLSIVRAVQALCPSGDLSRSRYWYIRRHLHTARRSRNR
jgi:hypothetical protein